MSDNLSFLTPLLASCGAVVAFLGNRHQHLSGLIRKKTEYIFSQCNELKPEEVENMMAQVTLLRYRNGLIESAVWSSLFSASVFAICIVLTHYLTSIESIFLLICSGLCLLLFSLYIAREEFTQSSYVLDLEIFLSFSKYRDFSAKERSLIVNNLLMYGETEVQQNKYLEYLLNLSKEAGEKKRGRVEQLLSRIKKNEY